MTGSPLLMDADAVLTAIAGTPGGVGVGEVLAAVAPGRALKEAWHAGDDGARVVIARALRDRGGERWSVPVLAAALDGGVEPGVRHEALRTLGHIGTPRARRAVLDRAEALWRDAPADLLQAAGSAGLTELAPQAFEALVHDSPVMRWRGAVLVAVAASPGAAAAIQRSADGIADAVWRRTVQEAVDSIGRNRRPLRPVATRSLAIRSPLFGTLPLTIVVGAPHASAGAGRPYARWAVRTRYAPLRFPPQHLARGDDELGALHQGDRGGGVRRGRVLRGPPGLGHPPGWVPAGAAGVAVPHGAVGAVRWLTWAVHGGQGRPATAREMPRLTPGGRMVVPSRL